MAGPHQIRAFQSTIKSSVERKWYTGLDVLFIPEMRELLKTSVKLSVSCTDPFSDQSFTENPIDFYWGKKKWKMISSDKWSVIYLHFLKTLLIKHYIKNLPGRLIHTASRIRSLGMITVAWLGVRKWLSQQMTDLANATRQKAVGLFA